MQQTISTRSPGIFTAGWRLERDRPSEYGYRDSPIERCRPAEAARGLPDNLRNQLLDLDMSAVDPGRLDKLAANLYWEGYISKDAFMQIGLLSFDHRGGPVDVLALMRNSLGYVRNARDADYRVAVRMYEAAIEAVEGMRDLSAYLKGQVIDVQV